MNFQRSGGTTLNPKNKSAKDLAFDKERAKMRQEKRELEFILTKDLALARQQRDAALTRAYDTEVKFAEQQEWIERLLEYTGLSKSELTDLSMAAAVKKENAKTMAQFFKDMQQMSKLFGSYHPPV